MYICVCMCMWGCACMQVWVYMCMSMCMSLSIEGLYMQVHVHTYICVPQRHTYMCEHAHTCLCTFRLQILKRKAFIVPWLTFKLQHLLFENIKLLTRLLEICSCLGLFVKLERPLGPTTGLCTRHPLTTAISLPFLSPFLDLSWSYRFCFLHLFLSPCLAQCGLSSPKRDGHFSASQGTPRLAPCGYYLELISSNY